MAKIEPKLSPFRRRRPRRKTNRGSAQPLSGDRGDDRMSTRFEAFRGAMALQEVEQVPVMPTITGWAAKQCGIPFGGSSMTPMQWRRPS